MQREDADESRSSEVISEIHSIVQYLAFVHVELTPRSTKGKVDTRRKLGERLKVIGLPEDLVARIEANYGRIFKILENSSFVFNKDAHPENWFLKPFDVKGDSYVVGLDWEDKGLVPQGADLANLLCYDRTLLRRHSKGGWLLFNLELLMRYAVQFNKFLFDKYNKDAGKATEIDAKMQDLIRGIDSRKRVPNLDEMDSQAINDIHKPYEEFLSSFSFPSNANVGFITSARRFIAEYLCGVVQRTIDLMGAWSVPERENMKQRRINLLGNGILALAMLRSFDPNYRNNYGELIKAFQDVRKYLNV